MSRTLFGLRVSPWTERARWALDHHSVKYAYHEHVPLIGELLLRRKARVKRASVPLLVDGDVTVMGSIEIARHADSIGQGTPLFPNGASGGGDADAAAVDRWVDLSERMLQIARAWALRRLGESRAALAEALPPFVPGPLRGALAPTSSLAVTFLGRKYDAGSGDAAAVERSLRPLFEEIRAGLGGRTYLLGRFSAADVAVSAPMQVLRAHAHAELGPATREAWSHEALQRDFQDLVAWRDALYAKHR